MSFLLKVISFPSQTEQSSGPRRLGNLFHKTDSLASIQSLSTPQPRRTNKSFSDAAPDTLRCMFHCFIPASVLLASCSKKKKRSRKHIEKYDETCEDVKFINHNLIWKLQKNVQIRYTISATRPGLAFEKANTFGPPSAILLSCAQCFQPCDLERSDSGFDKADKASLVAAFERGAEKSRL